MIPCLGLRHGAVASLCTRFCRNISVSYLFRGHIRAALTHTSSGEQLKIQEVKVYSWVKSCFCLYTIHGHRNPVVGRKPMLAKNAVYST